MYHEKKKKIPTKRVHEASTRIRQLGSESSPSEIKLFRNDYVANTQLCVSNDLSLVLMPNPREMASSRNRSFPEEAIEKHGGRIAVVQ